MPTRRAAWSAGFSANATSEAHAAWRTRVLARAAARDSTEAAARTSARTRAWVRPDTTSMSKVRAAYAAGATEEARALGKAVVRAYLAREKKRPPSDADKARAVMVRLRGVLARPDVRAALSCQPNPNPLHASRGGTLLDWYESNAPHGAGELLARLIARFGTT